MQMMVMMMLFDVIEKARRRRRRREEEEEWKDEIGSGGDLKLLKCLGSLGKISAPKSVNNT